MSSINITGTTRLDIEINERSSMLLALTKYEETAGKPPSNYPVGVWRMGIQNADGVVVLTLTQGDGLEVVANVLTINRKTLQWALTNGRFKYDIRCDLADGTNLYPFEGEITIKKRITEAL
jgi:hypothetical protein